MQPVRRYIRPDTAITHSNPSCAGAFRDCVCVCVSVCALAGVLIVKGVKNSRKKSTLKTHKCNQHTSVLVTGTGQATQFLDPSFPMMQPMASFHENLTLHFHCSLNSQKNNRRHGKVQCNGHPTPKHADISTHHSSMVDNDSTTSLSRLTFHIKAVNSIPQCCFCHFHCHSVDLCSAVRCLWQYVLGA